MALDLETLNPEQEEAVLTTEGPLLVLAGAGSGKTRVITYRLAHLIERRVAPKNILCVTFTNKAAWEMRTRARNLVGKTVRGATISTFHALGAKIIRDHAARAGLKQGFTITDSAEQLGSLRRILRDLRIDDRRFDVKRIMVMISKAKNAGLDAAAFRERDGWIKAPGDADGFADDDYRLATIESYDRYEKSLRAQNVADFDDLLLLTQRLLEDDHEVRHKLQARWRFLMVDEYQDTNGAQMAMLKLLAGPEKNVCVVGDDDQSIYGWRGADIDNILGFAKWFPGGKVIKLERNYRSTGTILGVANAIIAENPNRHDKTLKATLEQGDPVRIVSAEDEDREADLVAASIASLISDGVLGKDVAVLFRSNVQSRPVELAFRRAGVPYRVVGGMELFDRKEIKDILAYLRLLENPDDEQSLRRIINYPARGISDGTIEKADDWARARQLPLQSGLEHIHEVDGVSTRAQDAVTTFLASMAEHRKLLARRKVSTVAIKLVEAIGLENTLMESSDSAETASRRVDNVREVIRQIERYERRAKQKGQDEASPEPELGEEEEDVADEGASLAGFLADLALGSREDGAPKDEREDQVVLSTIHAAKGLEWHHVYLIGVEEELLPHARTIEGDGQIEEERRLAYVAATRARKHLTVSWARERTRWGRRVNRIRSRFLERLPPELIEEGEDDLSPKRTEEEQEARVQAFMAEIRAKLAKA